MGKAKTEGGVEYEVPDRYHHGGYMDSMPAAPTDLHRLARAMVRLETAAEQAEDTAAGLAAQNEEAYRLIDATRSQVHGAEAKIDELAERAARFITKEVEAVVAERRRQVVKRKDDDDADHSWEDWVQLIAERCAEIRETAGSVEWREGERRRILVQIGALVLAALEARRKALE